MKRIIFLLLSFICLHLANAQSDKTLVLAQQYYKNADYEKAAELFYDLWKSDNNNNYYYTSLLYSYIRLKEFDNAEKIVKKLIKKNKNDLNYEIDLGYVYSQNNDAKAAEKQFEEVIKNLPASQNEIRRIANKFMNIQQNDFAIKTYLKGRELLKSDDLFIYELGNVYFKENKVSEAVGTYLHLLGKNKNNLVSVQSILSNRLATEGVADELEIQLYSLLQKRPNSSIYPEMLIWLFSHQDDYEQALIQARALDMRNNEDGNRILTLAQNALQEKQYDAAIDAYNYLLNQKKGSYIQKIARAKAIQAQQLKITSRPDYTKEAIEKLKEDYTSYIDLYGFSTDNIELIADFAHLLAYYGNDLNKAIKLLNDALALPNINKKTKNNIKLELGDIYILADDVWEATLLYAQVDKDEKDSPLGEDARFRNARLSYYKGEFEWSQAQLKILKGATTELIANNALELSIFIMDNLGLDTTTATMEDFAKAELLSIQHKKNEALQKLDSILIQYPGHALTDDVYFEKAHIYFDNLQYEKAIEALNALLLNHSEDILADNATFMLGDIYENYIGDIDKAMTYYKKIITDFSASVLLVEARKRYRKLRGDSI